MKLIIIRHGDPDYEHDSLTQKGLREAQLLSDRISQLDVKAFYCSPLGRAQDTASYTLNKMNRTAETLPWLCEFEGKIVSGLKLISCWDRLPSVWTKYPEHYNYDTGGIFQFCDFYHFQPTQRIMIENFYIHTAF